MRMKLPALVISLLLLNAALPEAQGEDHLQTLQGEWTVAAAEQRGQPFDAIIGGVLTITEDRFALRTAAGNEFEGQLRIDATQSPGHLDFLHDDGLVWEAIYVAQADFFRLNYVEVDADSPRPTMFATTADTPGTVIVLQR
ncbi:MAG: TIGR03067 domain-containing protein [Acidobacteria bacterium]|nr:TIGR03067 domain-containing protein [Acidobacteriota bacterium]MXZ71005.1 TIGR03067 domain-containing protein [Acidobacteriota bacterium]